MTQLFRAKAAVIFDGDDTLWLTEPLYDRARSAAREIVALAGLDSAAWETLQRRIDVENVALMGHSSERFPTSCVQAYERLCVIEARAVVDRISSAIWDAARTVFEETPELVADARSSVTRVRDLGFHIALLTKGDLRVQQRRVVQSGLQDLFEIIRYVSDKQPEDIISVAHDLGVQMDNVWMVGNSIRSDILPALHAGARAIWIEAHVWEYERAHDHLVDDRVIVASRIADVPTILATAKAVI